jgi:hypothetical protein
MTRSLDQPILREAERKHPAEGGRFHVDDTRDGARNLLQSGYRRTAVDGERLEVKLNAEG